METPAAPSRDAPPSEVRTYLTTILKTCHGVPEAEALEIAANWQYGRGSEITYYDIGTYRTLFGPEAGVLLYGHARRELRIGRRGPSDNGTRSQTGKETDIFGQTPGSTVLLCWMAMSEKDANKAGGLFAGSFISVMGFVISYLVFYFGPPSH
ncbi:hypothetical protein LSUE1_G004003 [Lachnellula suecica]|uniref:Uncharacterized protein n=1 Tax=Lachnellula suecica TaxID=602035 RepID=A0A8T9CBY6_9HELO|nr:hypothetical protein LSUE1_G004003 [Lachnellula suecica]